METIDEFSKHELLDRLHCLGVMFSELVADHPAAALMPTELTSVGDALAAAYQKAGAIRFK